MGHDADNTISTISPVAARRIAWQRGDGGGTSKWDAVPQRAFSNGVWLLYAPRRAEGTGVSTTAAASCEGAPSRAPPRARDQDCPCRNNGEKHGSQTRRTPEPPPQPQGKRAALLPARPAARQ
ncbi:hypothetical protein OPT61_g7126 [Boeremia exigua]|uniref:Uncharacterized protein n=1 Tax=Boeremia exigua TaxID=749465 RepID=A0ACC2I3J7_9PLEO|nr:hypothetical protein OPT61_g7126 [Boeremia exigua]